MIFAHFSPDVSVRLHVFLPLVGLIFNLLILCYIFTNLHHTYHLRKSIQHWSVCNEILFIIILLCWKHISDKSFSSNFNMIVLQCTCRPAPHYFIDEINILIWQCDYFVVVPVKHLSRFLGIAQQPAYFAVVDVLCALSLLVLTRMEVRLVPLFRDVACTY